MPWSMLKDWSLLTLVLPGIQNGCRCYEQGMHHDIPTSARRELRYDLDILFRYEGRNIYSSECPSHSQQDSY